MNTGRHSKYLAFLRMGYVEARAESAELYGRMGLLVLILGVISALWRAIAESGMPLAEGPKTLVWYLAATEWTLLSTPPVHFDMEQDIRRGDVAYRLSRPVSYLGSLVAQGLGALGARAPVLLLTACGAAWIFAGGAPAEPARYWCVIPFGLVASTVMLTWNIALGLLAFWLGDIAPAHWIWQKLGFVLGGLMLPLELYPRFVVRIARCTPFPALLYGPASFMIGAGPRAAWLALTQLGWLVVAGVVATMLFRRARLQMQHHGG